MLMTTTPGFEGKTIASYHGIVMGQAVLGSNAPERAMGRFQRLRRGEFPGFRKMMDTHFETFEKECRRVTDAALESLAEQASAVGGNAVAGVGFSYQPIGKRGGVVVVTASGTAVTVE